MSRNLVLGAGLLVAIGVVVFLAAQGGGGPVSETEAASTGEPVEALQPARGEGGALPHVDAAAPSARAETLAPAAEPSREEVAALEPAQSFLLELQDEAQRPVAGAQVWVLFSGNKSTREAFQDSARVDALMQERGARHTASRAGTLRLAKEVQGRTYLLGRKDELWGTLELDSGSTGEKHVLVLKRDAQLRVQVLDPAGQPVVGATVIIEKVHTHSSFTQTERVTEGREGIAVFPHVQLELGKEFHASSDGTWTEQETRYRAAVKALTKERVAADLDPATAGLEVVVLTLPATGSVEVRVLDEEWQPYAGVAEASLESIPEGEGRLASPFSSIRRRRLREKVVAGNALFAHVELGLELGVGVRRDSSNVATRGYAPGPLRAGETTILEVRLGSDHPVVRLRALAADGHALADAPLECELQMRSMFMHNKQRVTPRTDERGHFLLDLDKDWRKDSSRVLTVSLVGGEEPRPSGTVDLSRALEIGVNELGDVVLGDAPVFARGRVETDSGQPIPSATLALRSKDVKSYDWDEHWDFQAKAKPDGTFEIKDTIAGDSFQLAAGKEGFACGWVDFKRGDGNVVIVMKTHGQLVGSVLLDEGIPAERIQVSIDELRDPWEHLDHGERRRSISADGTFHFERLMAGKRTVTLSVERQGGSLLVVEDVDVRSGEVCRDPRLDKIDLRGTLFLHELELVGLEPGERFSGSVTFGPAGAQELGDRYWLNESKVVILTRDERLDLVVAASGYRNERLHGFSGKTKLQLRKGLTVTLVLTGDAQVPEPPVFVKAVLVPVDGNGSIDWSGGAFDERREIKTRVAQAGKLKVEWVVERRSAGSSVATSMNLKREQLVDVLDLGGEQRIEISLTQDEMNKIVERFN